MLIEEVGGQGVVSDVDVAALHGGAPLRVPEVLVEAVDAPHLGQLDFARTTPRNGAVRRDVVEDAVRDPAEGGAVVAVVDLECPGRASGVTGRTLGVGTLHADLVALEAEHVV